MSRSDRLNPIDGLAIPPRLMPSEALLSQMERPRELDPHGKAPHDLAHALWNVAALVELGARNREQEPPSCTMT